MKCNKYIILLFSFAFTLFFAGCESDFVDPLVSPSIEIKRIPSISQSEITVQFTPSNTVARYEYAIGDDSDKEAFLNGTHPGIIKVENREVVEATFPGLSQNSVHTIFARAYNSNGTAGPLASIKEKTRAPSADIDAKIQYEAENSIGIILTADINYYKYDFALGFDVDRAEFDNGTLEGMQTREGLSIYTANYFDLQPGTEYIFFVRAYDRVSNLPTETFEIPVRTVQPGTIPAVECRVNHIDLYNGQYLFTPNEHVGKVSAFFTLLGDLDETIHDELYWKGNIVRMLDTWTEANQGLVNTGRDEPFTADYTTPAMLLGEHDPYNYPIEVFVLVYDKEMKPFAVQRFIFHTPLYDNDAKEASVKLEITDITRNGALYKFIPDENTLGIFLETFTSEWVQDLMQSGNYSDDYIKNTLYYKGYWAYMYKSVGSTYPERMAEPGKTYYVYYLPVNANGIDGFGSLQYQTYTTLSADQ